MIIATMKLFLTLFHFNSKKNYLMSVKNILRRRQRYAKKKITPRLKLVELLSCLPGLNFFFQLRQFIGPSFLAAPELI